MWQWLKTNKDPVSSVATILQAVAVIVGVFIAVNEFVIKDRQASRNRVETAFEIFRGDDGLNTRLSLGDLFFEVVGIVDENTLKERLHREEKEFYSATVKAVQRYTIIQACIRTLTCDEKTTYHLFCGDAFFDAFVAYKVVIRPPQWERPNYDARLDNLFDFALSCLQRDHQLGENSRWMQRRRADWDPILGPIFSKIEADWRNVMRDLEKSNGSNEGTAP